MTGVNVALAKEQRRIEVAGVGNVVPAAHADDRRRRRTACSAGHRGDYGPRLRSFRAWDDCGVRIQRGSTS
jgi:hypothetical protein